MKQFKHTQDNYIIINDGLLELIITLDQFLQVEPEYSLPLGRIAREPIIGREYMPDKHNRVYTFANEMFMEKDWEEGDRYIKNLAKYNNILNPSEDNVESD